MTFGTVLVNGAGGFLGSHMVEAFLAAGYEVRATDMPGIPLDWAKPLGAETVHADLRRFKEAVRVTSGVSGVVNVAGIYDFGATFETLYDGNVRVTENMCRAALEERVSKFVHVASIAVFGQPAYTPMDEDGPRRPKNHYELTKKLGEDVVFSYQRQHGLPATSLRPGPIYGPRNRYVLSLMFATNLLMAHAKKPSDIAFSNGPSCHHVHVHDVARAAVLLMQLPRTIGNAYICCDRTPIKWTRLVELVGECTGFQPSKTYPWVPALMNPLVRLGLKVTSRKRFDAINLGLRREWNALVEQYSLEPMLVPRLERDMFAYMLADYVYDTSRLQSLGFQWKHPDTEEGFRQTHQWLVDNRWIPGPEAMAEQLAA